jgi:hypothetical protein
LENGVSVDIEHNTETENRDGNEEPNSICEEPPEPASATVDEAAN